MPSMSFPEIEALRVTQPLMAEAMQKLVSLVAPAAVHTSGKGDPNSVIYGTVNTIYIQTDDTSGQPQWIKTGKSGTNSEWIKLATSANQVSGESPVDSGNHLRYTLKNNAVSNTAQVYINGIRSSKIFTVVNAILTFTVANAPTDKLLVDYVKAINQ